MHGSFFITPQQWTTTMETVFLAITTALSKVGGRAVQDAYDLLKSAIQRRYGAQHSLIKSIEAVERDPTPSEHQAHLRSQLSSERIDQDPEFADLASVVLQQNPSGQGSVTNISQHISGSGHI